MKFCGLYKKLKVLKIVKDKKVDVLDVERSEDVRSYNFFLRGVEEDRCLKEEEFDLLKQFFR